MDLADLKVLLSLLVFVMLVKGCMPGMGGWSGLAIQLKGTMVEERGCALIAAGVAARHPIAAPKRCVPLNGDARS